MYYYTTGLVSLTITSLTKKTLSLHDEIQQGNSRKTMGKTANQQS